MRTALAIVCLLACLALGACGGGGGSGDGGGDVDDPLNRWDQMDWNEGEWA